MGTTTDADSLAVKKRQHSRYAFFCQAKTTKEAFTPVFPLFLLRDELGLLILAALFLPSSLASATRHD